MQKLDSHFHLLSMKRKGLEISLPDGLIGIDVGTDPYDYEDRKELIPKEIDYSHAAGPWCLRDSLYKGAEETVKDIEACFEKYKGTFLGEIGLDYHWMYGTKEGQIELFIAQLDSANKLGLPVIIHSRNADDDLASILKTRDFPHSGIMHCFSSGPAMAKLALDKGLNISFAGNVTYKGNHEIQEAAKIVPKSRILYETDSPYLAPLPMRGKPSNPAMTDYTSEFLATLRNENVEIFRQKAIENFITLRSLSKGSLL